jgi:hypothetical protein
MIFYACISLTCAPPENTKSKRKPILNFDQIYMENAASITSSISNSNFFLAHAIRMLLLFDDWSRDDQTPNCHVFHIL